MQEVEQQSIKLRSLTVGGRVFRYIRAHTSALLTDHLSQALDADSSILLFFGSDVLANTMISSKNMTREHYHRSKTKHCCKVSFSTARLAGVRGNATDAWFYDVRGLIEAAFHFYSFEDQLALLKRFFTTWSKSGNINLPCLLSLSLHNIVDCDILPTPQKTCPICNAEAEPKRDYTDASTQQSSPIMVSRAVQYGEKPVVMKNAACQTEIIIEQYYESIGGSLESYKKPHIFSSVDGKLSTEQFLNTLTSVVKSYFQASTLNIFFYKVYNLVETFVNLLHNERHLIEATTTGIFPFHLILEYVNGKTSYERQNNPQVSPEIYCQDLALQIHSKWLATQFYKFRPLINTQIENYKKKLIEQNKCLPSSVQLTTECELYPSCMVEFLSGCMGGINQVGVHKEEEEKFHYSKMLLVLELLNDNPITGVGHVVYAKLKSSDFV